MFGVKVMCSGKAMLEGDVSSPITTKVIHCKNTSVVWCAISSENTLITPNGVPGFGVPVTPSTFTV